MIRATVIVSIIFTTLIATNGGGQELTATRLHLEGAAWNGSTGSLLYTDNVIPLVIANASPIAQPIRFLAGPSATVRALEIGAAAETWIRGSLSVGEFTGAGPGEVARIASIPQVGGTGLRVDMTTTTESSGIVVGNIGVTGPSNAGVMLWSASNGTGTGMRIGGATGSGRPTLGTGIDITGGTGIRYNALTSGSGTGVEIGGTTPPVRGVDATASGVAHIAVLGRANTNGVGVLGLSQSSAYTTVPDVERVGVFGQAATNSGVGIDTLVGVHGRALRGSVGSNTTISIGVLGEVFNSADNPGLNVGVFGRTTVQAPGQPSGISGLFIAETHSLAQVNLGGNTFLGSHVNSRPPTVPLSRFPQLSHTTTYMYSLELSGIPSYVRSETIVLNDVVPTDNLGIPDVPVIKIQAVNDSRNINGIVAGTAGRMIVVIATGDELRFWPEVPATAEANRILTPGLMPVFVPVNGSATLWYDADVQRWRVIGVAN